VVDDRRPDLTAEAVLAGVADVCAAAGRPPSRPALEREKSYEARQPARPPENVGDALYTHSPSMRDVVALISRASTTKAGVTIRGEEGTGRQVVARAIHAAQKEGAPFVSVDCAAHESDEVEGVLFGSAARWRHGESASGLERVSRHGRLHEALGGTLYLQNVAEAPTRVQSRLVRLLRDAEAALVETGATLRFDVRMMAGVEPNVEASVQDGRVRADLFKRLSVIRIDMPPLRNRREDIPALTNYFLREICAGRGVPPKALSRPALSLITALPWRGNAIELRLMLESIVAGLSGGKGIGLEDVLAHVRLDAGAVVSANSGTLRQARPFRASIAHVLSTISRPDQRRRQSARHPANEPTKNPIAQRQGTNRGGKFCAPLRAIVTNRRSVARAGFCASIAVLTCRNVLVVTFLWLLIPARVSRKRRLPGSPSTVRRSRPALPQSAAGIEQHRHRQQRVQRSRVGRSSARFHHDRVPADLWLRFGRTWINSTGGKSSSTTSSSRAMFPSTNVRLNWRCPEPADPQPRSRVSEHAGAARFEIEGGLIERKSGAAAIELLVASQTYVGARGDIGPSVQRARNSMEPTCATGEPTTTSGAVTVRYQATPLSASYRCLPQPDLRVSPGATPT
jgi:DNA-binding NtrC family response regulator